MAEPDGIASPGDAMGHDFTFVQPHVSTQFPLAFGAYRVGGWFVRPKTTLSDCGNR